PLLAEFDLLFRLARHKKVLSVSEVRAHWIGLGRSDRTLSDAAARIQDNFDLLQVLKGTGHRRLQKLLDVAVNERLEEQLKALLHYHAQVMKSRGQLRWVEAKSGDEIRVYGRTEPLPNAEKRPPGSWVNSYYIHQFYNLVAGYQGGTR
ncbi:unnamed protein product, partial [Ectocarpus sp. 12 AP-2014]